MSKRLPNEWKENFKQKNITSETTELQIIRNYYEQYINKLENLEEMVKFLNACDIPRLNHEETEKWNKPIARPKLWKQTPNKENPGPDGFPAEFWDKHLKKK